MSRHHNASLTLTLGFRGQLQEIVVHAVPPRNDFVWFFFVLSVFLPHVENFMMRRDMSTVKEL